MKNKIITIATFVGFTNRGAEALLRTRIASIRKHDPEATFNVLTIYKDSCKQIDGVTYIQTFGGQREKLRSISYLSKSLVTGIIWTFEAFRYRLTGTTALKEIKALASSDVFVSTDGDVLGEDYGLLPYIWRLYYLSLGFILKKPVIIYAEGIGPFHSRLAKLLSRLFFNRCSYLSVRDEISYKYMRDIGIEKPIDIVADSAFLLEPELPSSNIYRKKNRRLIGVAVSKLATQYGFKYGNEADSYIGFLKYMAEVIDWIVENLNAEVILIPHVVQVERDDFKTAHDIIQYINNKQSVNIVSKNTNASQLKGIIAECDLLIASRMHAIIAGLSTNIPVIGIAYSHKAKGLFKAINLKTIIDIKDLNMSITKMIIHTLNSSDEIKKPLMNEIERLKELAKIPAQNVWRILNSLSTEETLYVNKFKSTFSLSESKSYAKEQSDVFDI